MKHSQLVAVCILVVGIGIAIMFACSNLAHKLYIALAIAIGSAAVAAVVFYFDLIKRKFAKTKAEEQVAMQVVEEPKQEAIEEEVKVPARKPRAKKTTEETVPESKPRQKKNSAN
jgi:phosphotransferase system  glucose/maltose/N-acetylglucosamine-specific IIC component